MRPLKDFSSTQYNVLAIVNLHLIVLTNESILPVRIISFSRYSTRLKITATKWLTKPLASGGRREGETPGELVSRLNKKG